MGRSIVSRLATLGLLFAGASPTLGLELTLLEPAEQTARQAEAQGSARLAIGPFAQGSLPTQLVHGQLSMAAYRLELGGQSTLSVLQALQDQITNAGYQIVFTCETEACGGFDFRYGLAVLPEPDMHVNLGDFRYLLARKGAESFLALLVSRSGNTGFVQITQLGDAVAVTATSAEIPVSPAPLPEATSPSPASKGETVAPDSLIAAMERGRAVVLEDLVFASGSSALVARDYASLKVLADWLRQDSARKVVLVGHTDASGGLEGNIKLSRLRAESVRQALLYANNISPDQVQAEGIGYLSPRESNATEAGRQKNRRVEVMVTSTDLLAP